jgi:hypothetical protein
MIGIRRHSAQTLAGGLGGLDTPIIRIDSEPKMTGTGAVQSNASQSPSLSPLNNDINLETLLRQRALQNADGINFWPDWLTEEIFTEESITKQLGIDITEASVITAKYRKVLAILTLYQKENEIENFKQENLSDDTLPLVSKNSFTFPIARASNPDEELSCFTSWKPCDRENFLRDQYRMNPVHLGLDWDGRTAKHAVYDRKIILPFLKDVLSEQGGYSKVAQVEIHPRCHSFHDVLKAVRYFPPMCTDNILIIMISDHHQQRFRSKENKQS